MAEGPTEQASSRRGAADCSAEGGWVESGKVYGHRKLHDDLPEQGESVCLNRVARLTKLAGIKAQIGYKRRPGKYGGKPSVVVDNTLDRRFDVATPDSVWDETLFAIGSRTMVE